VLDYDLRLALSSLRRTPALTALMICAIGLGISVCIVTLTVYHAMSGNPIWWKNGVLYAVTMDSRDPPQAGNTGRAPDLLSYRDATYLYGSNVPRYKTIMTPVSAALSGAPGQAGPELIQARATSGDFFRMFDVPFEYGGPWDAAADQGPEPVIVLSRDENDKLFGGADSVGRSILFNQHPFRIVGVLDRWNPQPRYYDMSVVSFADSEDSFVPFGWDEHMRLWPNGQTSCFDSSNPSNPSTYEQLIGSGCVWVLLWVELPGAASRERFQAFVDAYWAAQHKMGRFQRARNNRLWPVSEWLTHHHVITDQSRLLLRLAFAFLAVCLINTVGIELIKFLRAAPLTGIRRALGASRRHVFQQHFVETALIALAGSALGLALSWLELRAIHALGNDDAYGRLAHFDPLGVLWALGLAALATIVAGVYPAWRIGRVAPVVYLKSQ